MTLKDWAPTAYFTAILAGWFSLVLVASAHCQSPTYTNADLGKPITWSQPPPTLQLQAMATRQAVASWEPGPRVASTGSLGPTLGPWEWPAEPERRRLDGSLQSDPPTIYGLLPYFPGVIVYEQSRREWPRVERSTQLQPVRSEPTVSRRTATVPATPLAAASGGAIIKR